MTGTDACLLSVRGLTRSFGTLTALHEIGLDLLAGEILALIGPNGAGKTTLMECVAGLLPADGGVVRGPAGPLPLEARKRVLFYVPDGIVPYPEHRVAEMLECFRGIHGRAEIDVRRAVDRLHLKDVLRKRIGALSKGTRKRFHLALGLLAPQAILLIDEPFDGLDLRQTQAAMDLLRDVRAEGRTLLLSIHQIADAQRIGDRFLLLREGRCLGLGSLADLRRQGGVAGDLEEVFLALT